MSNLVNKVKAKVENALHKDESSHSTNAGPHNSNLANKADPLVDSDRDGSRNAGASAYGPGAHHTGQHTAGPHSTDAGNKLDPRVDSDRDGSRNAGAATYGPGSHHTSAAHTAGPHGSDVLNKIDPRVDSDRDGSHNLGQAQYGPGSHNTGAHTGIGGAHHTTGTHGGIGGTTGQGLTGGSHSTNAGPHDSNLANKLDPRIDSDRDGSNNFGAASHGAHSGTGPAHGTAGPHSSNLANKLDPRVDSDLDGSKTVGGNSATHTTY
jgi:hypothetical protein